MSKSTPLSQLNSQDTPMNEEMWETHLTKKKKTSQAEILTEINNEAGDRNK